jgi:hypothetical protein
VGDLGELSSIADFKAVRGETPCVNPLFTPGFKGSFSAVNSLKFSSEVVTGILKGCPL